MFAISYSSEFISLPILIHLKVSSCNIKDGFVPLISFTYRMWIKKSVRQLKNKKNE